MSKVQEGELLGRVTKALGNGFYEVEITGEEGQTRTVRCYLSGRMRQHAISILVEDKVRLVLPPPYDLGRITFRLKE